MASQSTENPLTELADRVVAGARVLARQDTSVKNDALQAMADALRANTDAILAANAQDVADSQRDDAFRDRLTLTPERIEGMASAIEEVIALPDPVGRIDSQWLRPNGLKVGRQRIPLGVVGIIYEARPNVTSDAAALCFKSGNGVLLRGGSDAFRSNQAVHAALIEGMKNSRLPAEAIDSVGFVNTASREGVNAMLELEDHLDVIIPRGGKGLIRFVNEHSRVPVIKHDEGVCHIVVDGTANPEMVDAIVLNAKIQRPTVCNSLETLLFLESAVEPHLDRTLQALHNEGVELFLDARAANATEVPHQPATDEHYHEEFLALRLAVRVVDDLESAIAHINKFGSKHTEAILTEQYSLAQRFVDAVDSSCVMVNASTRFADGNQLGLGAEIGISTTRLHAYGPMGIEELTTTKFVVFGSGQVRS